ncbi:flagella synthesis protein FlgN [Thauera sinica]|uniref:Flagella synthesis protein FlgN n=1 Tax=Thauera sinica TaxID=2665146 RepID=A0ABW1AP45_9RHOO|nr:flagellar protein FlgN [Thauera sp. K11]ATE59403.1 flagellar protein FlgN [Thauera sp. K11]
MNRPPQAPTPADTQRLALLVEAEFIQLREFIAILEREEALLVAGDSDALVTLAQEKSDRYRQLQRLHDDRALLLARLGRPDSDASMRELCAGLPRVLARWDELLELARTAHDRNAINGRLIVERMAANQAALSVLLAAADHPQLYDADGQTHPAHGGRMLGSA